MECIPVIQTWRPLQSAHCLKLTPRCVPSLVWLDIAGESLRGWHVLHTHLMDIWAGEGASRKLEQVSLSEDALKAFEVLKHGCMTASVLAFANITKQSLLETDASKDGLGAVLSQKQADGWYQPVTYGSRALMLHEKNFHSAKLEFLVLKWMVTGQFQGVPALSVFPGKDR